MTNQLNDSAPKTFIVDVLIMELYRKVATLHGYVISDTEYEDEWLTTYPGDSNFNNTVSSALLLHAYIQHNVNDKVSYSSHDEKELFLVLDTVLTEDASRFNLSPHIYLRMLSSIQDNLFYLSDYFDDIEDVTENVKKTSFKTLQQMFVDMQCQSD